MARLALLLACLLAGCSSANLRRDLDVTGSLPRVIGLGGFAPQCFFLCFVSNEQRQGDVIRDPDVVESLTVHDSTEQSLKGGAAKKLKVPTN